MSEQGNLIAKQNTSFNAKYTNLNTYLTIHKHYVNYCFVYLDKAVGVITNTRITHATPASAYAHSVNRYWESDADIPQEARDECDDLEDIASQLITKNPNIQARADLLLNTIQLNVKRLMPVFTVPEIFGSMLQALQLYSFILCKLHVDLVTPLR